MASAPPSIPRRTALAGLGALAGLVGLSAALVHASRSEQGEATTTSTAASASTATVQVAVQPESWGSGPSGGAGVRTEDRGSPGSGPPPSYHPRDPSEWQGMLVDLSMQATCEASAECGLAMACHDGRCGPCARDAECARGERCVLDHCVRAELAGCARAADCRRDELCILSGYSAAPRGNEAMNAACRPLSGGEPGEDDETEEPPGTPAPRLAGSPEELIDELREARRRDHGNE